MTTISNMSGAYNIALDCVDRHAGSGKTALYFVREGKVQTYTFAEMKKITDAAAVALLASPPHPSPWFDGFTTASPQGERGLIPGDRVVIALPNSPEFMITFIGAIKAGLIPIPVSSMLTQAELNFIVQDSGARMSLRATNGSEAILPLHVTDCFGPAGLAMTIQPTSPNDPAYWLYTSGTEGTPKGVIHAHRSIPAHDARMRRWLDYREGDIVFNTSTLNWSYALTCGWLDIWRQGGTVVVYSGPLTGEAIWRVIRDLKVTILLSVPGIYRRLVGAIHGSTGSPRRELPLRVCLSAGEKLDEEIRQKFLEKTGIVICEGLGMTEHSVYLIQPAGEAPVKDSCGKPLPGTRIEILDVGAGFKPAPTGQIGVVASHKSCPGLMLGYHDEKNDSKNPWFLSNDLAYKDKDGNFFFLGRRDDVITAGGYRISPMEVEAALNRHPAVVESAAVGKELEPGKTIVSAFVVASKPVSSEDLRNFAGKYLAFYKVPHQINFVDKLPKTSNGKIKRKEFS